MTLIPRVALVQHTLAMFGQITGGLPLLLITALLAHTQGLERAGHFTIIVGLSAAIYSIALWEFRSYVVLEGFARFSAPEYAVARAVALVIATIATICVTLWMGISLLLAVAVMLYRTCDAIIDLVFGFNIVWRGTSGALHAYAMQNALKLAVLCLAAILSFAVGPHNSESYITASGLVVVVSATLLLVRGLAIRPSARIRPSSVIGLFFQARWFAIATIGVVTMTSAPRVIIAWLYRGDLLGVVGVSLSITSFVGIAFSTTWVRYLPRFRDSKNRYITARNYLFEIAALSVLAAIVSFAVLPSVTALVFGFSDPHHLIVARGVLVAGVVFFGCMSLANLYKATSTPWMEFIVYLVCFVVVGMLTLALPAIRSMVVILVIAGITMLGMSLLALRDFRLTNTVKPTYSRTTNSS